MGKYSDIFKRTEKKYLITYEQSLLLLEKIGSYLRPDEYGVSTINNIYFDTPDFRLIRASIEKPTVYKEKLRIRCYGSPNADTNTFVELKKKYKGVVYKRRVNMTYYQAIDYLCKKLPPPEPSQITNEIDYFMRFYKTLRPRVSLFYDRMAYYSKEDKDLRITFDTNIRFRMKNLDISQGSDGYCILDENFRLMEIKSSAAMPLWLTDALSELKIYPTSYSKYGMCYRVIMKAKEKKAAAAARK